MHTYLKYSDAADLKRSAGAGVVIDVVKLLNNVTAAVVLFSVKNIVEFRKLSLKLPGDKAERDPFWASNCHIIFNKFTN